MRRLVCILFSIIFIFSSFTIVQAEEKSENNYYNIQVEFSDKEGTAETLQVLVKNKNIYANAEQIATRLGYQVSSSDKYVAIYNKEKSKDIPYAMTLFYFDSTKIQHMLFDKFVDYEAAYASIKNSDGEWIPLEQTLLLLNSSLMVVDSTILIDMPSKNIVDIYMDIMKENQKYEFDFTDDIGISEKSLSTMADASFVVQQLSGLLKKDGASWVQAIHNFALDSSPYDAKYGEKLAMLFCTYSDSEFKEEIENMKEVMSHINGKSALGKTISALNKQQTQTIKGLQDELKKIGNINHGNIAKYNRTYQALEKAYAQDDILSGMTGLYTSVQKELSSVTDIFDKILTIAEVVGYAEEFANQDKFAVQALLDFSANTNSSSNMSEAMKHSIVEYSDRLQGDVATYSALRYLNENYMDIISEALNLSEGLSAESKLMLIVWDLLSENVPFYKNGIEQSDSFILSIYADIFESDAFLNYQNSRNEIFQDSNNITAANLYKVSEYCYTYLKSCYINRKASLGALTDSTKEKIPYTIKAQETINSEIAQILVKLKNADTTNENLKYGFLPENNEKYLKDYNSSILVEYVDKYSSKDLSDVINFEWNKIPTEVNDETSNETIIFESIPHQFVFTSGVGGWSTEIEIKNDGTFTGQYHDTAMGLKEVYICNFNGKFYNVKQIDDYTYSMSLEYIKTEGTFDEFYYENGMKYIYTEPYGFDNAHEFMLYLPGIAVSKLPQDFLTCANSIIYNKIEDVFPDGYYGLYNVEGKEGFVGSFDW